jgi:hypothetical protein
MAKFSVRRGFDLPCPVTGEWVSRYLSCVRPALGIYTQLPPAPQFATPAELALLGLTSGLIALLTSWQRVLSIAMVYGRLMMSRRSSTLRRASTLTHTLSIPRATADSSPMATQNGSRQVYSACEPLQRYGINKHSLQCSSCKHAVTLEVSFDQY